jgi:acetyl-CoA C-acetyltransferase
MGNCAELCAEHYQISRQEMDDHAIEAFQRAQAAAPFMQAEVVPVQLPASKAAPQGSLLDYDESLGKMNESKLRGLKPYFKQVSTEVTCMRHGGGVRFAELAHVRMTSTSRSAVLM